MVKVRKKLNQRVPRVQVSPGRKPLPKPGPGSNGGPSGASLVSDTTRTKQKRPRLVDKSSSDEGDRVLRLNPFVGSTGVFTKPVPRYLFLRVQEEGKSFKEMSPFLIARTINAACGGVVLGCRKLADGSLLVTAGPSEVHSLR